MARPSTATTTASRVDGDASATTSTRESTANGFGFWFGFGFAFAVAVGTGDTRSDTSTRARTRTVAEYESSPGSVPSPPSAGGRFGMDSSSSRGARGVTVHAAVAAEGSTRGGSTGSSRASSSARDNDAVDARHAPRWSRVRSHEVHAGGGGVVGVQGEARTSSARWTGSRPSRARARRGRGPPRRRGRGRGRGRVCSRASRG